MYNTIFYLKMERFLIKPVEKKIPEFEIVQSRGLMANIPREKIALGTTIVLARKYFFLDGIREICAIPGCGLTFKTSNVQRVFRSIVKRDEIRHDVVLNYLWNSKLKTSLTIFYFRFFFHYHTCMHEFHSRTLHISRPRTAAINRSLTF